MALRNSAAFLQEGNMFIYCIALFRSGIVRRYRSNFPQGSPSSDVEPACKFLQFCFIRVPAFVPKF